MNCFTVSQGNAGGLTLLVLLNGLKVNFSRTGTPQPSRMMSCREVICVYRFQLCGKVSKAKWIVDVVCDVGLDFASHLRELAYEYAFPGLNILPPFETLRLHSDLMAISCHIKYKIRYSSYPRVCPLMDVRDHVFSRVLAFQ